jgi:hypothetical protein
MLLRHRNRLVLRDVNQKLDGKDRKSRPRVLLALMIGIAACASAIEDAPGDPLKPGIRFPRVNLKDVDSGELRSLEEWRGRPLILWIFASW